MQRDRRNGETQILLRSNDSTPRSSHDFGSTTASDIRVELNSSETGTITLPILLAAAEHNANSIDPKEYVRQSRARIGSALNNDELTFLRDYCNRDYALHGPLVRAGKRSNADYKEIIDKLLSAGLGVERTLYRGLDDANLVKMGTKYIDRMVGSACIIPNRAIELAKQSHPNGLTGVCLHIIGARAVNVSGASHLAEDELEALIRPDEPFDVVFKALDPVSGLYHALLVRDATQENESSPQGTEEADIDDELDDLDDLLLDPDDPALRND